MKLTILDGLPVYGPLATPFPPNGKGAHREGLVVEFQLQEEAWIGNFQPGWTSYSQAIITDHKNHAIIIAKGRIYLVDAVSRELIEELGCSIDWGCHNQSNGNYIFSHGIGFFALDGAGVVWSSERVSWDGMKDLIYDDGKICGKAYSPIDDGYHSFTMDCANGEFEGGSYNGPPMIIGVQ